MNLDDLVKVYDACFWLSSDVPVPVPDSGLRRIEIMSDCHRAGIAAVVLKFRHYIGEAHCAGQRHQTQGVDTHDPVDTDEANRWSLETINEILGDAGEAAGSGIAERADEQRADAAPAADLSKAALYDLKPAEPFCEWTRADKSKLLNTQWWSVGCAPGQKREGHHSPCPSCGKTIKFKEPSK